MDANGTRFHLVLGERDLALWTLDRVSIAAGVVRLRSRPRRIAGAGGALSPSDRRGAAADEYGHVYSVSIDRTTILIDLTPSGPTQTFWPRPPEVCPPHHGFHPVDAPAAAPAAPFLALAVTCGHLLVAATSEGLWVFDLHAGGPPTLLEWPPTVEVSVTDLARRPSGGLYVLDGLRGRVWSLDQRLGLAPLGGWLDLPAETSLFRPTSASAAAIDRPRRPLPLSLGPGARGDAVSIEALDDDRFVVLERSGTESWARLFDGATEQAAVELGALLGSPVEAHDLIASGGQLLVSETSGLSAQAVAVEGNAVIAVEPPRFLPLDAMVGASLVETDAPYYLDHAGRWRLVAELPRPQYEAEGFLVGPSFDGDEPRCVWHRVFLDACIGPGTRLVVAARAADSELELAAAPWISQPAPYLRPRGSELPFEPRRVSARPGEGTWELLLQGVRGRFAQLRLHLEGNGRATPTLHALRLYYPRFSYLAEYLPGVFAEAEGLDSHTTIAERDAAASFLERFLANPEGLLTDLEGRIGHIERVLDVRSVPAEYLEWLGGWMGVVSDPTWTDEQRRAFLTHADRIFRERGTVVGLERLLALAIAESPRGCLFDTTCGCGTRGGPRIVERFTSRRLNAVVEQGAEAGGLSASGDARSWKASDGGRALDGLLRTFLAELYPDAAALSAAWETSIASLDAVTFSAVRPAHAQKAADWRRFLDERLTMAYATVEPGDRSSYQSFLAGKYRHLALYARDHRLSAPPQTWADIDLPAEDTLPADGTPLADWVTFVSAVLPVRNSAHRFSVLVPALPDETEAVLRRRIDRVHAVVLREKPAHTDFEVRLFWDLFRVGVVRVGEDSEVGPGSRFVPLVLDRGHLAEVFVSEGHPFTEADRWVAGRDRVGELPPIS